MALHTIVRLATQNFKIINVIKQFKGGRYELIFLLLLFVPLFAGSTILEPTNLPRFLFVSLLIVIFSGRFIIHNFDIPSTRIIIPFLLYITLNYASIFWAINRGDAFYECQKILIGFVLIIVFLSRIKQTDNRLSLYRAVVIVALALGLFTTYEMYIAEGIFDGPSLMIHGNLLSSFLFLTTTLAAYLAFNTNSYWRYISIATILISLYLIIILQSRAVWIAVPVSIVCFLFGKWIVNKGAYLRRKASIAFFGLLMIGIGVAQTLTVFKGEFIENSASSLQERQQLWKNSFQLVAEKPFSGVGAGNWQYNYQKFGVGEIEKTSFYNASFKRPHNDFIWVLSETGLVGLLLVVFLISYLGYKGCQRFVETKDQELLLILSALVGLLIISLFSFPKERIMHIVLTALFIAVLIKKAGLSSELNGVKKKIAAAIMLGGISFGLIVGYYRFIGEHHTANLLAAKDDGKAASIISEANNALSVFYTVDPTTTPIYSYLGEAYIIRGQLDSLLIVSEKAVAESPHDYKVISNYGYALMRNYQLQKSETILL